MQTLNFNNLKEITLKKLINISNNIVRLQYLVILMFIVNTALFISFSFMPHYSYLSVIIALIQLRFIIAILPSSKKIVLYKHAISSTSVYLGALTLLFIMINLNYYDKSKSNLIKPLDGLSNYAEYVNNHNEIYGKLLEPNFLVTEMAARNIALRELTNINDKNCISIICNIYSISKFNEIKKSVDVVNHNIAIINKSAEYRNTMITSKLPKEVVSYLKIDGYHIDNAVLVKSSDITALHNLFFIIIVLIQLSFIYFIYRLKKRED